MAYSFEKAWGAGCCRHGTPDHASEGPAAVIKGHTLESCKAMCEGDKNCHAIEFHTWIGDECELHMSIPTHASGWGECDCYAKSQTDVVTKATTQAAAETTTQASAETTTESPATDAPATGAPTTVAAATEPVETSVEGNFALPAGCDVQKQFDHNGFDLYEGRPAPSYQVCAFFCTIDPACEYYTHTTWGYCYLKGAEAGTNGMAAAYGDSGHCTKAATEALNAATSANCDLTDGYDYAGFDLTDAAGTVAAASAVDCAALCWMHAQCYYYTYTQWGQCYLKSQAAGTCDSMNQATPSSERLIECTMH